MLLNSVLNEGVAGMHQSQKKMLQAAQDIVKAGLPRDGAEVNPHSTGAKPKTDAGTAADDLPAAATVEAGSETAKAPSTRSGQQAAEGRSLEESLVAQKEQQLIFDALATVVKTGSETVGTLIDDLT